jgi:hypothetical protein
MLDLPSMVRAPEAMAEETEALIKRAVEDCGGDTVLFPMAEAHFLLAVAALEAARQHFRLADYLQCRKD